MQGLGTLVLLFHIAMALMIVLTDYYILCSLIVHLICLVMLRESVL